MTKREEAWWYWSQGLTHDDPLLNPKEGPKKETFSMTSAWGVATLTDGVYTRTFNPESQQLHRGPRSTKREGQKQLPLSPSSPTWDLHYHYLKGRAILRSSASATYRPDRLYQFLLRIGNGILVLSSVYAPHSSLVFIPKKESSLFSQAKIEEPYTHPLGLPN